MNDSRFVTSYLSLWQCVMRWPRIQLTVARTREKRTRRVSFKGKEPQHAIIMFLPCHPYKVNRGGDNRDDPRRILEDSVDCVCGLGWLLGGRDESSAQAQRDGGGGGFGGLVVGCLRSKLGEHCRCHKPHTKSGQ